MKKFIFLAILFVIALALAACAPESPTVPEAPQLTDLVVVGSTDPAPARAFDLSGTWPEPVMNWEAETNAAANENGIPGNLLAAICLKQSGCTDPTIIGPTGEVGLLQIVASDSPRSGHGYNDRPTTADLKIGAFNLNYGAGLLAEHIDEFYRSGIPNDGSLSDEAIEYAVSRYIGTHGHDELISEIMELYLSHKQ